MLKKKTFIVSSSGETRPGMQYTSDTPGKGPVIFFFHGMGQAGSGEFVEALMTDWGPLHFVKKGWSPNYTIVAMQNGSWTIPVEKAKYVLDNDQEVKDRWDGKNVLWTGLSAGGQSVQNAMALRYPGAFVPLSMASGNPVNYNAGPYKLWAFHSDPDPQCPFSASQNLVNGCNAAFPGTAKLTKMKNPVTGAPDGHGNWNYYYDPAYRESGKNIYEWAFDAAVSNLPVTPPTTPPPSTVKAIAEVKNLTQTTATLDGSKSEGVITWSVFEMVSPDPASHPNVFPNYQKGGPVLNINNLKPNTDYQFRYTVNGTVSTILAFRTLASTVSPVFVESDIPEGATHVIVRQDKTIEFT